MVSCARCRHFIIDPVGDGSGVGECRVINHYRDKGMSQRDLDNLFKNELGGRVFWRGTNLDFEDRNCTKFVRILDLVA